MSTLTELSTRMNSINDSLKITNAMYMIASSKMQKINKSLQSTEEYFGELKKTISVIISNRESIDDIYFEGNNAKKHDAYIVITGDKGLCGTYNSNIFRQVADIDKTNDSYELFCIGYIGKKYLSQHGKNVDMEFDFYSHEPSLDRARRIAEYILEKYKAKKIRNLSVIYTNSVSLHSDNIINKKLLPMHSDDFSITKKSDNMILYPDAKSLIDSIILSYISGFLYGAMVEAYYTEEEQRMLSMKKATDNGMHLLEDLKKDYNSLRQAKITNELTEIVNCAKTLKRKRKENGINGKQRGNS